MPTSYVLRSTTNLKATALFVCLIALLAASGVRAAEPTVPPRALKICVAADAPAPVREAAKAVLAAVTADPLLRIMAGAAPPAALTDTAQLKTARATDRAYSHLVVVGLPSDPIIRDLWQHEARLEDHGLYIYGFGHLSGDIGYIESGRNPYLHGDGIKSSPFETEAVTITGTTPVAVALAAYAFLKQHVVNGVIAATGWKRPSRTLLDRDPLGAEDTPPPFVPSQAGDATAIGWTEANQEEYLGVEADANAAPSEIWRCKYYVPGSWDGAGDENAIADYLAGLHRRAYGNTLWCARFATDMAASEAAPKIADAARLKPAGDLWQSPPPAPSREPDPPVQVTLWRQGAWLLMSTLPFEESKALIAREGSGKNE